MSIGALFWTVLFIEVVNLLLFFGLMWVVAGLENKLDKVLRVVSALNRRLSSSEDDGR